MYIIHTQVLFYKTFHVDTYTTIKVIPELQVQQVFISRNKFMTVSARVVIPTKAMHGWLAAGDILRWLLLGFKSGWAEIELIWTYQEEHTRPNMMLP